MKFYLSLPISKAKNLDMIHKINKGRLLKKADSLRILGVKIKYSHEIGGGGVSVIHF